MTLQRTFFSLGRSKIRVRRRAALELVVIQSFRLAQQGGGQHGGDVQTHT